jgi:ATP-dependent Clp protease ATP-binding subunit ClpC
VCVFDKLDDQAVKAILAASEEARRQGHKFVDTEQLLLGLMSDSQSLPARVLSSLGLKAKDVRQRINDALGRGEDFVGIETPFTTRLNSLLETAWQEANRSGKTVIGTTDLLLGLMHSPDGTAGTILAESGITADKLRQEMEKL